MYSAAPARLLSLSGGELRVQLGQLFFESGLRDAGLRSAFGRPLPVLPGFDGKRDPLSLGVGESTFTRTIWPTFNASAGSLM
jgi:hypothetical protein